MPVPTLCPNPNCGEPLRVADEGLGGVVRCEGCGAVFPLDRWIQGGVTPLSETEDAGPKPTDVELPSPFGPYEVIRRLGRGGMGAVYLARDTRLERLVALKVPHRLLAQDPGTRGRFLREARAAARFHHPNFCPILDIGEIDGLPYLTMPFIEGGTLASRIERASPWDPRRAAEIVRTLARALAEAHRAGIVHRDLKPANVMIDARGGLVILDFGLARRLQADDPTLTTAGMILGTPGYMPPEQAEGQTERVGPRSDVYSLGVMLYELIAGRRPFEGSASRVLAMILTSSPPSPSSHHPEVVPLLESICLRAMAREIEDRYPSMEEFAGALDAFLEGPAEVNQELPAPTRSPGRWRIGMVAAGAWVVLGIAVYVASGLGRSAIKPPKPGESPITNVKSTKSGETPIPNLKPPKPGETSVTNSIGMTFQRVPAGEFDMGSDASNVDDVYDEQVNGKKHRVRITRPFYLGTTEVTVGQFRRFVEDSGYKTDAERDGRNSRGWNEGKCAFEDDPKYNWRSPGFPQDDNQPVVFVSWNDVMAFCEWLGRKEGRTYRLPTEAEWEYACRAGGTTRYYLGDDPETLAAVGNVADGTAREKFPEWKHAIKARDGFVFPAPVGSFPANSFGLHDMQGNVGELCADFYDKDYYEKSPLSDPMNSSPAPNRSCRGGGWFYNAQFCRSADRSWYAPDERAIDLGFRVVQVQ